MRRVIKYQKDKVESDFASVSSGYKRLEDELSSDSHYYDRVRYIGKISPKIYFMEKNIKNARSKRKIVSFLD